MGLPTTPDTTSLTQLVTKSCRKWSSLLTNNCKLGRKTDILYFRNFVHVCKGVKYYKAAFYLVLQMRSQSPRELTNRLLPPEAGTALGGSAAPHFWVESIPLLGKEQVTWAGHRLRPRNSMALFHKKVLSLRSSDTSLFVFLVSHFHVYWDILQGIMKVIAIGPSGHSRGNSLVESEAVFSTSICFW